MMVERAMSLCRIYEPSHSEIFHLKIKTAVYASSAQFYQKLILRATTTVKCSFGKYCCVNLQYFIFQEIQYALWATLRRADNTPDFPLTLALYIILVRKIITQAIISSSSGQSHARVWNDGI
jgi:hypothetical protein